jgi:hypothetical protein
MPKSKPVLMIDRPGDIVAVDIGDGVFCYLRAYQFTRIDEQEDDGVWEQAFASRQVDEAVAGDGEDVQIELGLREERETPGQFTTFADWNRLLVRSVHRE